MNIAKMILLQKDLDEVINKNHPIKINENRSDNKVAALVVELAEFANEARFFKYWSEDLEPRTTALEEYVDGVHFFLSVAIDMGWEKELRIPESRLLEIEIRGFAGGLTRAFNQTIFNLMRSQFEKHGEEKFHSAWFLFMAIGLVGYGFSEEEVEAAYMEKNLINHERQNTNY